MELLRKNYIILFVFLSVIGVVFIGAADVDGNWSPWSAYSSNCTKECGGGLLKKQRSCSNPSPKGNGKNCTKSDGTEDLTEEKDFPCNEEQCKTGFYWIFCDNCTNGIQVLVHLCDNKTECTDFPRENHECRRWNKTICPSTCESSKCPDNAKCTDTSTDLAPSHKCECTMGTEFNSDKTACVRPPPPMPTPKPIPTLPPGEKTVATVISKSASSVLIMFVTITLALFLVLRIFSSDRVIQMNMEIALVCAHICLILPPSIIENKLLCRIISILIHFFFTACFNFMMLEALHMYSLVAFVIKKDGFFNRLQNCIVGWGLSAAIVLICVCFQYDNYGAEYHCWLRMDTPLLLGQLVPILIISIVTLALIEAAGSADYKPLKGLNMKQLISAKISQRTNLIILFFVIAHMFIGMLSEYEQNLPLYGTFSILNGVTGALVFFLHCSNSQQVRAKLQSCFGSMGN